MVHFISSCESNSTKHLSSMNLTNFISITLYFRSTKIINNLNISILDIPKMWRKCTFCKAEGYTEKSCLFMTSVIVQQHTFINSIHFQNKYA